MVDIWRKVMRINIHAQGFDTTEAIKVFVQDELNLAFDRFRDQVVSIDVFMKDINGPKGGIDKQALIRVRLRNRQRIALETTSENLYGAIKTGIRKSKRAVRRSLRKSQHIDRISIRSFMEEDHAAA
jgi:ribosomal subunit interface protein